ncbi:MAG: ComEA family DNA-binding protein [Anaeromicrobium sp.]|jgi:competence protein ComEA|uniref:ComEA family DNA-binding protein n=1 Tax=Anaeromicrobium sp. TaxID=1929132 RepID=UPI0025F319E0|nr:ComEA family DNA-binding protein [Anaeromicrobium sp.]MCT4594852.1 ComEA family DNA-binding protein [Anaeromicrobium sp.]
MKKERIVIGLIIVISLISLWNSNYIGKKDSYEISINEIKDNMNEKEEDNVKENRKIIIDICGSIKNPGIIELKENSRVADAIQMAGGFRQDVDRLKVNLAKKLIDGEQIYIPSINDKDQSTEDKKVNINLATKEELINLNGIGESLAVRIIEYRSNYGNFEKINDIMNVTGIGSKKFDSIKDFIRCY